MSFDLRLYRPRRSRLPLYSDSQVDVPADDGLLRNPFHLLTASQQRLGGGSDPQYGETPQDILRSEVVLAGDGSGGVAASDADDLTPPASVIVWEQRVSFSSSTPTDNLPLIRGSLASVAIAQLRRYPFATADLGSIGATHTYQTLAYRIDGTPLAPLASATLTRQSDAGAPIDSDGSDSASPSAPVVCRDAADESRLRWGHSPGTGCGGPRLDFYEFLGDQANWYSGQMEAGDAAAEWASGRGWGFDVLNDYFDDGMFWLTDNIQPANAGAVVVVGSSAGTRKITITTNSIVGYPYGSTELGANAIDYISLSGRGVAVRLKLYAAVLKSDPRSSFLDQCIGRTGAPIYDILLDDGSPGGVVATGFFDANGNPIDLDPSAYPGTETDDPWVQDVKIVELDAPTIAAGTYVAVLEVDDLGPGDWFSLALDAEDPVAGYKVFDVSIGQDLQPFWRAVALADGSAIPGRVPPIGVSGITEP